MAGGLGKLLDRNFVLSYILPALLLVVGSLGLLRSRRLLPDTFAIDFKEPIKDGTVLAVLTIVTAVGLMTLNLAVYQFLEGYRPRWVARFYDWLGRTRFIGRLVPSLHRFWRASKQLEAQQAETPAAAALTQLLATSFPRAEQLLPTRFGNELRASEDYAVRMYEFPPVVGWARLAGVLPKEFVAIIETERALMDLWVNLWFVSVVLVAEYVLLLFSTGIQTHIWFPIAGALFALLAYRRARLAAATWGTWLRATYDLFLPDLAKKLGFQYPVRFEDQRLLWNTWWRAISKLDLPAMQSLDRFRAPPELPATPGAAGAVASLPREAPTVAATGEGADDEEPDGDAEDMTDAD